MYSITDKGFGVLAAGDHDENLWHAIHALQTRFRKNW
jgi:hypothetical protein